MSQYKIFRYKVSARLCDISISLTRDFIIGKIKFKTPFENYYHKYIIHYVSLTYFL